MRQKPKPAKEPAETVVNGIRRATRKHYSAEEGIEIIRLVEQSNLSVRETLERIGIPRPTPTACSTNLTSACVSPSWLCRAAVRPD
jgi:predicted DNA-binding protein (UPF0251 family)